MSAHPRPVSFHAAILFFIFLLASSFSTDTFAVMPPEAGKGGKSQAAQSSKKPPRYKEGELLIKLRDNAVVASPNALAKSMGATKAEKFKAPKKSGSGNRLKRWWRVKLPSGKGVEAALAELRAHPDVEIVEPNYEISIMATPNDPRLYELWGMHNTGQTGGTDDADIDAPEGWDKQTGNGDVVVAVIDTGVDYTHEDLAANMWTNSGEIPGNGLDDDNNGIVDDIHGVNFITGSGDPFDDNGHGTHCAGTIAGVGDNGIGVAGINWSARIMALKFADSSGGGSLWDAMFAIAYAIDMGADVMSNSWGTYGYSLSLQEAIRDANDAGIVFVAAAGNANWNNDHNGDWFYPAAYPASYDLPNIISVAATDHNDTKASFSNYGAATVDLGAPGVSILSTVPTGACELCDSSGYLHLSGTSMATPHVAGAAALLLAQFPGLTVAELKDVLLDTVDPVASLQGITVTGGRLNISRALSQLDYAATFTPSSQQVLHGGSVSYTLTLTSQSSVSDTFSLNLDTLAAGLGGTVSPASLTLPANGTASATVTVTTTAGMNRGTYPVRLLMTDSSGRTLTREAQLRVLVPDYGVTITPVTQFAWRGANVNYTVVLNSVDSFSGPMALSAAVVDPGLTATLVPTSLNVPADGSISAVLGVDVSATAAITVHPLTVTATNNGVSKTATAHLRVVDVDLVPVSVSTTTNPIGTGGTMIINDSVTNTGSEAAGGFSVAYYLSTDATIDTNDIRLGTRTLTGLAAGATSNGSTTVTVPASVVPGNYHLGIIVDYLGQREESNEANNALAGPVVSPVYAVDVVISEATPSSANLYTGRSFTLTDKVTNLGVSATGFFYVGYFLSPDATITATDTYLGYRQVSGLAGGGINAGSMTLTVPTSLTPGTYYLGVIADYYNNMQPETNETNNVLVVGQVQVLRDIDLTVTAATPSTTTLYAGASFTLSETVVNGGSSSSNGQFSVGYYLSSDAIIDTTDTAIGYRTVSSLAAGGTSTVNSTVTVPTTVQNGTYYLGVIADNGGSQSESDETNNVMVVGQVTVTRDLDLTMTTATVASTTLYTGANVAINNTVLNQGGFVSAGTFKVGFYLSTDATVDTADWRFGERTVYGLAAGGTNTLNSNVTLHQAAAPGTYYLGVIVDYANTQTESNETNNVFVVGQVTVVRDIDLVVSAATLSASTLYGGASYTLDNTVLNQGNSPTFPWGVNVNVAYRLSSDAEITTSDRQIGYRNIYIWGNLTAGQSDRATSTVTIPADLAPGTYYLGVTVSGGSSITESNNTNNVLVAGQVTVVRDIDLAVTVAMPSSTTLYANSNFTLDNTVVNQGSTASWAFNVGYYLSTDAVIDTTDTLLGSRSLSLAAGATSAVNSSVAVPASITPGTYYLGVIADYGNTQPENNEANNVLVVGQVTVAYEVDLVVTAVTPATTSLVAGTGFNLVNTVKNQGGSGATFFYIRYYLSSDPEVTTSDIWIGQRSLNSLAAGATSTVTSQPWLPTTVEAGTYYLGVIVDAASEQTEIDETNNVMLAAGQVTVTRNLDLTVTNVVPSSTTLTRGASFTLSNTVVNQATAVNATGFYVGYYLSSDATVDTTDTRIGNRYLSSLNAGATSAANSSVTVPTTVAPGTYYLGVIVDYYNAQPESDETDNVLVYTTPITVN